MTGRKGGGEKALDPFARPVGARRAAPLEKTRRAQPLGEKSALRFASGTEVDFAEEALRALGDDHFDGVG
jgi:hypothetical protein